MSALVPVLVAGVVSAVVVGVWPLASWWWCSWDGRGMSPAERWRERRRRV